MGTKACESCGEMVDEAKAFCPGCGHAFVEEEKREQASKYESFENTVQFGQTMYNMMLSDMGLNISKPPNAPEKRVEVLEPASVQPDKLPEVPVQVPATAERRVEVLEPVPTPVVPVAPMPPPDRADTPVTEEGSTLRYVVTALVVVFVFVLMVAIFGLAFYWMRFGS